MTVDHNAFNEAEFIDAQVEKLRKKIGKKKVLLALSCGIDSSVCAVLLAKAVGNQLTCILVDHGLMRTYGEKEIIRMRTFLKKFDLNIIHVNAQDRFLARLAGISYPETKRKIIGEEFIRVFEEEANKLGTVHFFAQGTIYSDIAGNGTGKAGHAGKDAYVRSRHNVGGLPDTINFKEIIEPLRALYKDEVRKVGLALEIPEESVYRQPFPGPGLAIRIIGDVTVEKLKLLRDTDYIFREEIENAGLGRSIWQYFTVLTNHKSVGISNSVLTYGYTVVLRAVNTTGEATAEFAEIPFDVIRKVSDRIASEVAGVNRVVYDVTAKPPGTVEWE